MRVSGNSLGLQDPKGRRRGQPACQPDGRPRSAAARPSRRRDDLLRLQAALVALAASPVRPEAMAAGSAGDKGSMASPVSRGSQKLQGLQGLPGLPRIMVIHGGSVLLGIPRSRNLHAGVPHQDNPGVSKVSRARKAKGVARSPRGPDGPAQREDRALGTWDLGVRLSGARASQKGRLSEHAPGVLGGGARRVRSTRRSLPGPAVLSPPRPIRNDRRLESRVAPN